VTAPLRVVDEPDAAAAILDPVRRQILALLREPGSASSVARALAQPRQRVNYHVRELERAGLVREVGPRSRGSRAERLVQATASHYLIAPGAVGALAADPAAIADRFSSTYLVAVAARAIQDLADLRVSADAAGKRLPTLTLETEVRFASQATQHAFGEELAAGLAKLIRKYHDADAAGGRSFNFIVGGYPTRTREK
jgi:DNA-binding transcriptional ArsR family regulator